MSGRLTAIPGASDVFRGAVVSYASEVKYDLLEVSSGPVVNEPAAIEMAEGVQRLLGADVGLSLTGVAGPTEQDGVAVGTVCIGIALPTGSHASHRAPRLAARADPPVRRDQRARPAAPPPRSCPLRHRRAARRPAPRAQSGYEQRPSRSAARQVRILPGRDEKSRRGRPRALPTGFEPAHCGLEGRCSVRTELREPDAAAYGRREVRARSRFGGPPGPKRVARPYPGEPPVCGRAALSPRGRW